MEKPKAKSCIVCNTELSSIESSVPSISEVLKFCPNEKCYRYGLVTGLVRVQPQRLKDADDNAAENGQKHVHNGSQS